MEKYEIYISTIIAFTFMFCLYALSMAGMLDGFDKGIMAQKFCENSTMDYNLCIEIIRSDMDIMSKPIFDLKK